MLICDVVYFFFFTCLENAVEDRREMDNFWILEFNEIV